jgi:cytochrome c551/c552
MTAQRILDGVHQALIAILARNRGAIRSSRFTRSLLGDADRVAMAESARVLGNDKRIGCTACHDPHADLVRDDSSYDHNCLACHAKASAAGTTLQKSCPVSDRNCVSCHMPKVELPGSHSVFTDHHIRIVHAGDRYPN